MYVLSLLLFVCLFVYSFVNFFIALGDCLGVGRFFVVVVFCFFPPTSFYTFLMAENLNRFKY